MPWASDLGRGAGGAGALPADLSPSLFVSTESADLPVFLADTGSDWQPHKRWGRGAFHGKSLLGVTGWSGQSSLGRGVLAGGAVPLLRHVLLFNLLEPTGHSPDRIFFNLRTAVHKEFVINDLRNMPGFLSNEKSIA